MPTICTALAAWVTESGTYSKELLAANVSIKAGAMCQNSGPGIPPLADALMICAGGDVADACSGDSGQAVYDRHR
jgi:secreted trypsin-like serine protease